ncbi:hypothetical protein Pcinc_032265, partial [Petrolisthes cinctipes]
FVYLEDCGHTIEADGLEYWLEQEPEKIGMKKCPKCHSTIYNNRRYQHIILQTYKAVKEVKDLYNNNKKKHTQNTEDMKRDIQLILRNPKVCNLWQSHTTKLIKILGIGTNKPKYLNDRQLQLIRFQAQVLEKATNVLHSCDKEENKNDVRQRHYIPTWVKFENNTKEGKRLKLNLKVIVKRIMERDLTVAPQMMREVSCELQRQMILPPYWKFQEKVASTSSNDLLEIKDIQAKLELLMDATVIFDEELDRKVRKLLKESEKCFGGLGISDGERVMILQAMGLKQGHCYKCPKGHIYCIGECGGAMEESSCPHCHATIGGRKHKLRRDNSVASEMDGATHSAWSHHYHNMANFDIDNI